MVLPFDEYPDEQLVDHRGHEVECTIEDTNGEEVVVGCCLREPSWLVDLVIQVPD